MMETLETCDVSPIEMKNTIKFLESLVSQYEVLVDDMSKELVECKEDLRKLTKVDEKRDINLHSVDGGGGGDNSCGNCKIQEKRIENLSGRLEKTKKSGEIQRSLWTACVEQLEKCEKQKLFSHSLPLIVEEKSHSHRPQQQHAEQNRPLPFLTIEDLFTKWKLLQIYASGLEGRIEKIVVENNMYRKRFLESKLEHELNMKKQAVQRAYDIESTKKSFQKEIDYWKQSVEKLRKEFSDSVEKRIDEERENWKSQEKQRQNELLMKMESTIADSEAFLLRDTQMSIQLREIARELLVTRKKLESAQQEIWHLKFSLQTGNNSPASKNSNLPGRSPILKSTAEQTEELLEVNQLKELRTQINQLQLNYTELLESKAKLETESHQQLSMAMTRLKELEGLCRKLEAEVVQSETDKIKAIKDLEECKKQAKIRQREQIKEDLVNLITEKPNVANNAQVYNPTIVDVQRMEEKRRQIREMTFTDHIQNLERERHKLINMLDKQKSVAIKWQKEYNLLIETLDTTT